MAIAGSVDATPRISQGPNGSWPCGSLSHVPAESFSLEISPKGVMVPIDPQDWPRLATKVLVVKNSPENVDPNLGLALLRKFP